MVSKRWQKNLSLLHHITLTILWGGPLFLFQLDLMAWQKLSLIAVTIVAALLGARYLMRVLPGTLVKVFKFQADAVTGIVQRALNANMLPFSRRASGENVWFTLRTHELKVVVQPYPLNLPVDDHIRPISAAKIEIFGLNDNNRTVAEKMCRAIDEALAASVERQLKPTV